MSKVKSVATPAFTSSSPRISVLLPAYNAARYLPAAIESVLRQSEKEIEVVAVDDGSTDATEAILRRYARADPRVRVISRPNTGIVGALNDALAAARGRLVARMDADDVCLPARLAHQRAYLDAHPEVVLVGCNVLVIDADGDDVAPLRGLKFDHEQIDAALLARQWPLVHPTVFLRREAIERVGGYREGTFPHEDHDLFLRLGEVGRLAAMREVLLRYRRHPTSVSWDARSYHKMADTVRAACVRRGIEYRPDPRDELSEPEAPEPGMIGKLYRTWAWQALSAGNVGTARKYAWRAMKCGPLVGENLKLLACVARGR